MAYQQEQYVYAASEGQHGMYFQPPMQHIDYPHPTMTNDQMLGYPGFYDQYDFFPHGVYMDEYDDVHEMTTRPRLTKEQQDLLESEFQKNPKPSSALKRTLAAHTGLNLPRVANWFQNRRAKAKQMRKLEEYEREQQFGQTSRPQETDDLDEEDDEDIELEANIQQASDKAPCLSAMPSCISSKNADEEMKERAWKSLQRTLKIAEEARERQTVDPIAQEAHADFNASTRASESVSPASGTTVMMPQSEASLRMPAVLSPTDQIDWTTHTIPQQIWPTPPNAVNAMDFDFGFDSKLCQARSGSETLPSPTESGSQHTVLSPGSWDNSSAVTPTVPPPPHEQLQISLQSPSLIIPRYTGSRRPSIAESLTNNFDGFAISTGSAHVGLPISETSSRSSSRGVIDLASRRQRPRPAPINSASLRSRSYGALTAASPTYRQGSLPSPAQTLRHVKSTGHSLNSHYSGIRKSSMAQKSPLNISTFAESEYQQLLAQKAAQNSLSQQSTPVNTTSNNYAHMQAQSQHFAAMHQIAPVNVSAAHRQPMHSPPVTPYQTDFVQTSSMLPPSIQAQYATFADYTPPYSAGPLTNSSWSDAPLTSPDIAQFSQAHFIPPMVGEMQTHDPSWLFSDNNFEIAPRTPASENKTQFYIQEFPNQKKEHAQAAQQLNQSRPKHYAFQHHKPEDFVNQS